MFADGATNEIAKIAFVRGTGAKGLRSVVEEVLEGVLFDPEPGMRYVITDETVHSGEALRRSMTEPRAPLSAHLLLRFGVREPS
jgi:ATP-dependent protease Clp ATPase subunit